MRKSILLLLLLALPISFVGAAPAEAKDPQPPRSLSELGERLNELAQRIQKLIEEASKDADELKIEEYENYSSKQLKKTRGRVRAQDLVTFMVDKTKNFSVRQRAQKAIHQGGAIRNDPELSTDEKAGSRTKRSAFCKSHLLEHLLHEDRTSRALTQELLLLFWPVSRNRNPEILAYNKDREDTWKNAKRAWGKYLGKK